MDRVSHDAVACRLAAALAVFAHLAAAASGVPAPDRRSAGSATIAH